MAGEERTATAFVKDSFTLLLGSTFAKIISTVGMIVVARLLTPSEYGLFSVTLVIPGVFSLFSDWGLNSALIRYTAKFRSEDDEKKISEFISSGLLFKIIVGSALSLFLFFYSENLASLIIKRPEVAGYVKSLSLLLVSQSVYNSVISIFTGMVKMERRTAISTIQAIVKGVFSPFLVYIGYGIDGVIIGHVSSYFIAALIGIIAITPNIQSLRILNYRNIRYSLTVMFEFGLPLFLGGFLGGFVGQMQGLLLSWYVSNELIGNYQVAARFASFAALVTSSISINLYPTFSKYDIKKEPRKTLEVYEIALRYSAFFVIPMTLFFMTLSKHIVYFLFSNKYPQAPFLFSLSLIPMLFIGTGSHSFLTFFNSQGDTRTSMQVRLLKSVFSFIILPPLVWAYGIIGLALGIITIRLVPSFIGIYIINNKYKFRPDVEYTIKTLLCSIASAGITYIVVNSFSSTIEVFNLCIGLITFLLCYIVLAPVFGAIESEDVDNLVSMLKGLGIIYKISLYFLEIEKKILIALNK